MHAQSRTAFGDTRGSDLGSPVAREDDAAKAAEYRAEERDYRANAETFRQLAAEADRGRLPFGTIRAEFAGAVARGYRDMALAAETAGDRAADRAADYECHASLQVSA